MLLPALLLSLPLYGEERLVMSHKGMDAYLKRIDCRKTFDAALEIKSQDASVFFNDRVELQRLIGQVRAVLSIECPEIKRITAKGTVKGKLYFAGATEKRWRWRILGIDTGPDKRRAGGKS